MYLISFRFGDFLAIIIMEDDEATEELFVAMQPSLVLNCGIIFCRRVLIIDRYVF
jgi:hypothetical protein